MTALDRLDAVADEIVWNRGHFRDGELVWVRKKECLWFYTDMRTEMLRALVRASGAAVFDPRWLERAGGTVEQVARAIATRLLLGAAPFLRARWKKRVARARRSATGAVRTPASERTGSLPRWSPGPTAYSTGPSRQRRTGPEHRAGPVTGAVL